MFRDNISLIVSGNRDTAIFYSRVFKRQFPSLDVDGKINELLRAFKQSEQEEKKAIEITEKADLIFLLDFGQIARLYTYANVVQKVPDSKIILYNFEKLSGYVFSVQIIKKLRESYSLYMNL